MLPLHRQNAYRTRYAALRPSWRTSGETLETWLRAELSPASRVLDVGCGRGGVLEVCWREVALPVGLDPDWASLAERRAPLPVVCGWGCPLPFANASFDVVLMVWVLEHLPDPHAVLSEVARVLRPGGACLALTPNARHPLIWANRLSQALPALQSRLVRALYARAEADTFRVHYRANTPAQIRHLANQVGLLPEALCVIADPSYVAFNDMAFGLSMMFEACLPAGWGVHVVARLRKPHA